MVYYILIVTASSLKVCYENSHGTVPQSAQMQRAASLAEFTREAERRKGIKATAHVWMFEVGHPNMAENCFQDALLRTLESLELNLWFSFALRIVKVCKQ